MYIERNTEVCSNSRCCRVEAIGIMYSEGVFVALGIEHQRACDVLCYLCGLSVCPSVPHYLVHDTTFVKTSLDIKVVFNFSNLV
jgi:hypothetical protein